MKTKEKICSVLFAGFMMLGPVGASAFSPAIIDDFTEISSFISDGDHTNGETTSSLVDLGNGLGRQTALNLTAAGGSLTMAVGGGGLAVIGQADAEGWAELRYTPKIASPWNLNGISQIAITIDSLDLEHNATATLFLGNNGGGLNTGPTVALPSGPLLSPGSSINLSLLGFAARTDVDALHIRIMDNAGFLPTDLDIKISLVAVPEPGTYAMLGTFLGAIGYARKRKSAANVA